MPSIDKKSRRAAGAVGAFTDGAFTDGAFTEMARVLGESTSE